MTTPRKTNDRATAAEIIKINARLTEVCEKLDGGMCAYKAGFTDAGLAEEIGVSKASVANIRQMMFGKLRARTDDGEIAVLKAKIDQQAEEIAKLQDLVSSVMLIGSTGSSTTLQ
jgi:hypothetical protein